MIALDTFKDLVRDRLGRDLTANAAQDESVSHDTEQILMVVAGPGSGKTTVLVLRALKHVLVDGILPEHIVITTFTVKAAKELRTRWLDWGNVLIQELSLNANLLDQLDNVDLNRCRINTLDSLAEQTLSDNRLPAEVAPVVLEESAATLVFKRIAFSPQYSAHKADIDLVLGRYTSDQNPPRTHGLALVGAKQLVDRLIQDQVDIPAYAVASPGQGYLANILNTYSNYLTASNMFDFAHLEQQFLTRIRDGSLTNWCQDIEALLIDEYQDTNPLQENIYFSMIAGSTPAVTIVGDDDQSMYRFRGGSVELFTRFADRCMNATGLSTYRVNMVTNYRSSEEIVDFYNSHVTSDPAFASARILPPKPLVTAARGYIQMPVLGMFRPTAAALADNLTDFVANLLANRRSEFGPHNEFEIELLADAHLGDMVLLGHSVEEVAYDGRNNVAGPRFAGHLRTAFDNSGMELFNPRGLALRGIVNVQRLLGLILLAVDPDNGLLADMYPTNEARFYLDAWRREATDFIATNPGPNGNGGISQFLYGWQQTARGIAVADFPPDWPVLELLFKLITWIPEFQSDPEHQVWLEAISRTVSSSAIGSPYRMQLFQSNPVNQHRRLSRQSLIRDALFPIAEDDVRVDEDIMPSVPRNRLQLMTIHQAKGLEFPLVIVDVGSRFTRNQWTQAFMRFPRGPSNVAIMEDDVEPYLPSPLRGGRTTIDRTFDDLVRLYYVAFSRPQSVLILVGCEACLTFGSGRNLSTGTVPNISCGWRRNGTWPWRQPYAGRPPVRVNPPFLLI